MPHAYGRLQFGEDLDLFFRTLIGTGSNPNVAACVVIGIEPEWTSRIVDGIAKTGKPVAGFSIERNGDLNTIADASRKAKEFVQWASEKQRETCPIEELFVSVKCGESDTTSGLASCPTVGNLIDKLDPLGVTSCFGETTELTGAEMVCASRAATKEVADRFMRSSTPTRRSSSAQDQRPVGFAAHQGQHRRRPDDHRGEGVRQPAEDRPADEVHRRAEAGRDAGEGPGLYFMDTSSAAAECITLQAAAGFVVHLFPTGQGNIIGNPIEPVIKLTANPAHRAHDERARRPRRVRHPAARDDAGRRRATRLIEIMLRTCNGRLTCAEALGHREFVITKLYPSA